MPALSPTMTQGNLASWKKKIGEELQQGDVLAEIETDKAVMDMEWQDDGFLVKIVVEGGAKEVQVGEVKTTNNTNDNTGIIATIQKNKKSTRGGECIHERK